MAKAPKPGAADEEDAAGTVVQLRVKDEVWHVNPGNLPTALRFECRRETGLPVEAFFSGGVNALGMDSIIVLLWLAQRTAGKRVTFEEVNELVQSLGPDDVEATALTGDDAAEVEDPQS